MSHELSPLMAFVNPTRRVKGVSGAVGQIISSKAKGAKSRAWKGDSIPGKLQQDLKIRKPLCSGS